MGRHSPLRSCRIAFASLPSRASRNDHNLPSETQAIAVSDAVCASARGEKAASTRSAPSAKTTRVLSIVFPPNILKGETYEGCYRLDTPNLRMTDLGR